MSILQNGNRILSFWLPEHDADLYDNCCELGCINKSKPLRKFVQGWISLNEEQQAYILRYGFIGLFNSFDYPKNDNEAPKRRKK